MPFRIPLEVSRFRWTLDGDTPAAQVETIGNGAWVMCCPLCGLIHDVTSKANGTIWQPTCTSNHAPVFKRIRAAWVKEHPQAADYQTVRLAYRQPAVIIEYEPLFPALPEKKAA